MQADHIATLERCPFCGLSHTLSTITAEELWNEGEDDPAPWSHSESWAVICDGSKPDGPGGCGATGGFMPTEAEAIALWNRRTIQQAQAAQEGAAPGVPAGYKLVPVEPTDAMLIAAQGVAVFDERMASIYKRGLLANWKDMLAAAPSSATPIAAQGDALDAARYRWLRGNAYIELQCDSPRVAVWSPESLDLKVDAAMRKGD